MKGGIPRNNNILSLRKRRGFFTRKWEWLYKYQENQKSVLSCKLKEWNISRIEMPHKIKTVLFSLELSLRKTINNSAILKFAAHFFYSSHQEEKSISLPLNLDWMVFYQPIKCGRSETAHFWVWAASAFTGLKHFPLKPVFMLWEAHIWRCHEEKNWLLSKLPAKSQHHLLAMRMSHSGCSSPVKSSDDHRCRQCHAEQNYHLCLVNPQKIMKDDKWWLLFLMGPFVTQQLIPYFITIL